MHESRNLDHFGIVAAVRNEIKLEDKINDIIGIGSRQKIACGQPVKAMVLITLGFVDLFNFYKYNKEYKNGYKD